MIIFLTAFGIFSDKCYISLFVVHELFVTNFLTLFRFATLALWLVTFAHHFLVFF